MALRAKSDLLKDYAAQLERIKSLSPASQRERLLWMEVVIDIRDELVTINETVTPP